MAGTSSTPIFIKDGQYLSFTADAEITLGNVVELTTTGTNTCTVGTVADNSTSYIGVAVGGDRYSRTSDDDKIASGQKVTVCTRGVVRVYTDTSAILVGSALEAGANGTVSLAGTNGTAGHTNSYLGYALDANDSSATTIRMKLMR